MNSRRVLQIGGLISGGVLIAFGIVVIVLAINGRNTVHDELTQQQITGTPDMTPAAIKAEGAKAGLKNVTYPTCSVAGEAVDTGSEARCFSQYMNIHALEATGGFVYAQMGQYEAKPDTPKSELAPGGGTSNSAVRGNRSEDRPARVERCPQRLGDRDVARNGPQRQLHGNAAIAVQSRRGGRAAARGRGLHRSCCRRRVDAPRANDVRRPAPSVLSPDA